MKFLIVVAALVVVPVMTLAQKTSFDFDKTADFTTYKTFALREGTPVGDKLLDDRFIANIEAELAKKKLTKAADKPDMLVTYHVAFDKQKDIQTWSTGGGGPYGWGWGGGWGTTDVRVYEILVGTLVIDVADAAKNAVVWRGMGVKEVDVQAKADKRDKNVAKAVEKVLKNFPPKQKKK
jgi:Domain of unknown function (DUF4136)